MFTFYFSFSRNNKNPINQNASILLDLDYLTTKTNLTGNVDVIFVDKPQLTEQEPSDKNGGSF